MQDGRTINANIIPTKRCFNIACQRYSLKHSFSMSECWHAGTTKGAFSLPVHCGGKGQSETHTSVSANACSSQYIFLQTDIEQYLSSYISNRHASGWISTIQMCITNYYKEVYTNIKQNKDNKWIQEDEWMNKQNYLQLKLEESKIIISIYFYWLISLKIVISIR